MVDDTTHEFPPRIYVRREEDASDPEHWWLNAEPDMGAFDDGDRVAIYELKETRVLKVTRELT